MYNLVPGFFAAFVAKNDAGSTEWKEQPDWLKLTPLNYANMNLHDFGLWLCERQLSKVLMISLRHI